MPVKCKIEGCDLDVNPAYEDDPIPLCDIHQDFDVEPEKSTTNLYKRLKALDDKAQAEELEKRTKKE